jgi:hypothetical protein
MQQREKFTTAGRTGLITKARKEFAAGWDELVWSASNGGARELERLPLEPWTTEGEAPVAAGGIWVLRRRYLRDEDDVRDIFLSLAEEWEEQTLLVTSPRQAAMHPAYQRIIGLGLQAVPLLLTRLQQNRRAWFWALAAITHEDPAVGLNKVGDAINAWLDWGRQRGYLEDSTTT